MEPHERRWWQVFASLDMPVKHRRHNNRRARLADTDLRRKRKIALLTRTKNRMRRRGK